MLLPPSISEAEGFFYQLKAFCIACPSATGGIGSDIQVCADTIEVAAHEDAASLREAV